MLFDGTREYSLKQKAWRYWWFEQKGNSLVLTSIDDELKILIGIRDQSVRCKRS